jgi:rubrerythrin
VLAQEVLQDIANEEKEHAGEFLRLLRELDPDEEKFYLEVYKEVEEIIMKIKKRFFKTLLNVTPFFNISSSSSSSIIENVQISSYVCFIIEKNK